MRSPGQLYCRNLPPLHPPNRPRAFRRGVRHLTFFGPKSPPRRGRKRGRISDGFPRRLGDDWGLFWGGSRGHLGALLGSFSVLFLGGLPEAALGSKFCALGGQVGSGNQAKTLEGWSKINISAFRFRAGLGSGSGAIWAPFSTPKCLPNRSPKGFRNGSEKETRKRAPQEPQMVPKTTPRPPPEPASRRSVFAENGHF